MIDLSKNTAIKPYKLKNGETRYMFRISLGTDPLTGKQRNTTRRSFDTERKAQVAYDRLKYEARNGLYKKQHLTTYQEVYDQWIVDYKKGVEKSTFDKTEGIFRNHILPAMGHYRIEKINYQICKKHVYEWRDKLVRFHSVKSYASRVLDEAINLELIDKNHFDAVKMPKGIQDRKKKEFYYTREQLIEFLNLAKSDGDFKVYAFFRLLGFSGIRKGEALALTWRDIDFDNNTVDINKALGYSKEKKLYVKSTKTGESRIVDIDVETMNILKAWQEKQYNHLEILDFGRDSSKQLVFQNRDNKHLQPSRTWSWLNRIFKKYKLKHITTHGFRHTHATLLTEAGASLPGTQQRLGHSGNDTTTDVYIHVTEKIRKDTLNQFIKYMNE